MLGGNGAGLGTRAGGARPGNGTGLTALQVNNPGTNMSGAEGGRFDDRIREYSAEVVYSGSEPESDSGDDDDTMGSAGDRRGVKRERAEMEVAASTTSMGQPPGGYGGVTGGATGAKPGKKTRGRVKIKMEFIDNKLRRYTTFSKRKTGIMKKAYELSTLTGTQVLLLVASETGHVYTFATRKLQPMITSETGKALIQTCLNSPDSPPRNDPSTDQRMSATGFEETDLTYQVSEGDGCAEPTKDMMKPTFTMANLPAGVNTQPTSTSSSSTSSSSVAMHLQNSIPATCWQVSAGINTHSATSSANGTVLKTSATSTSVMLPGGFTLMSGGGMGQQLQAIQVHPSSQQSSVSHSDLSHITSSSTVSLPTTIVTSSVPSSMGGHMMYPGAHTVMYATPTTSLGDGSLTVLNTFPQTAHTQSHDPGAVSQVFLTGHPGTVQIPVSAVQLHPMLIGQQSSSSNLTELQVVNLDAHHSKDD
ncbi:serum response factor-like isoform X3 [Oncorhynchus nerka]|uniref:Serum response factor n=1 Tax=Oncorhynchus tshawytscha TaxID=74940 RepID=A0AAZ3NT42_ONCTS|nr:serum response factor a isoform X4 [Oncorhynchus tshawytscha]XP_029538181.1 serum response factor-like isoform X3 [Oncorhynchus nerka]